VISAVYQVLGWRSAGKINLSGHFAAAIRQPMATGFAAGPKQIVYRQEKGELVTKSPFITLFAGAQKLNVMPVVAALMVAPPIVSLLASREQTW
jgi:hypothetical protein